jgi:flagellar protein FlbD
MGRAFLAEPAVPTDDDKRDSTATRTHVTPTVRGEESRAVITVTRLDGTELVVNAELIELVEATPDTHLTFINGRKLIVQEDSSEIVARVISYRREAYGPMRAIQIAS